MKNRKKLPKYWLGTSKPRSLGYQPNYGIGSAQFSSMPGESIEGDVKTAKATQIPNAINKGMQTFSPLLEMSRNISTITTPAAWTTVQNTITPTVQNVASNTIRSTASNGLGASLLNNNPAILDKVPQAIPSSAKNALNTAGKALGVVGGAYSAFNIANDIINAGDHRSIGDMYKTLNTNTISTAGGNQYTTHSGLNTAAERELARQKMISSRTNLAMDTAGLTGAVAGLAGLSAPWSLGLSLAAIPITYGLASLFGFGDNSDEIEKAMRTLNTNMANEERQNKSIAETLDARQGFYNRTASAAKGKRPVYSPFGKVNRKATARVSNGELIGNFADGYVTRVPGEPNNKDSKLAALKDSDFVISNKYGLSDYAAATGDYEGALNMQDILMRKYKNGKMPHLKCGKLPGFKFGIPDYAALAVPHINEFFEALGRKRQYENADTRAINPYIEDTGSKYYLDMLASRTVDTRPAKNDLRRAYNQQAWGIRRMPGIGAGGRMVANANLYTNNIQQLADINAKAQDARNALIGDLANAGMKVSAADNAARMQGLIHQEAARQAAEGRKFNAIASANATKNQALAKLVQDMWKGRQYEIAQGWQNRMMNMYDRQLTNDENRILADLAKGESYNTSSAWTPEMLNTYATIYNLQRNPLRYLMR